MTRTRAWKGLGRVVKCLRFGRKHVVWHSGNRRSHMRVCMCVRVFLLWFFCCLNVSFSFEDGFGVAWLWVFLILRLWVRSLLARLTVLFVWCVVIGLTLFVYDLIDFVFVIDFWLIHTSDRKIIKETTLFAYVKKIIIMNLSCTSILVINISILIIN